MRSSTMIGGISNQHERNENDQHSLHRVTGQERISSGGHQILPTQLAIR